MLPWGWARGKTRKKNKTLAQAMCAHILWRANAPLATDATIYIHLNPTRKVQMLPWGWARGKTRKKNKTLAQAMCAHILWRANAPLATDATIYIQNMCVKRF